MNARKGAVALWAGLAGLVTLSDPGLAASGTGGLFSATACISPAVLLVLALTPAETLVTTGVELLENRLGTDGSRSGEE